MNTSQEDAVDLWRRYVALDAERIAIIDGATDLADPFERYDEIRALQAALRAKIGEAQFARMAADEGPLTRTSRAPS